MFTKNTIKIIIIFIFLCFLVIKPVEIKAGIDNAFDTGKGALAIVSGSKGAGYNSTITLETIAGKIITGLLSVLGIIFILFTIYGGYLYLTAHGNEEQTKKALSIITENIIGLIIVLGAYALTYFIIKFFI